MADTGYCDNCMKHGAGAFTISGGFVCTDCELKQAPPGNKLFLSPMFEHEFESARDSIERITDDGDLSELSTEQLKAVVRYRTIQVNALIMEIGARMK